MSLFAFLPFLFADETPRNVFELQMMSLENHGITLQYERLAAPPRISVLTALGFRLSGGHDYDVVEMDYGVEGRLWLVGKAPFVTFSDRTMIGPYLGVRFDTGLTHVSADGHSLGGNIRLAESGNLGIRVVFFKLLEVTPSLGFGLHTDFDPRGRLSPWTRPELVKLGLTMGALF